MRVHFNGPRFLDGFFPRQRHYPTGMERLKRSLIALTPIVGLQNTGTAATLTLPIGYRYEALFLKRTGTSFTLGQIPEIRLIANEDVFMRGSATEFDTINQYHGLSADAGTLAIWFTRPWLRNVEMQDLSAINTGIRSRATPNPIRNFRLEMDTNGATSPVLAASALVTRLHPARGHYVIRQDKWNENVAATGVYTWQNRGVFQDGRAEALDLMMIKETTANLTHLHIERNNTVIYDADADVNALTQTDGLGHPVAGYQFIDPTTNGDETGSWPLTRDAFWNIQTTHGAVNAAMNVVLRKQGRIFG